ncbi:MAG: hypothetical protein GY750_12690 [Lentisphaerae bacterium]|nr:hypothetical protein [Lentisphaerota bacterium]MCP4102270.1 hypothetical protein [Lentisphaerota bacterium]
MYYVLYWHTDLMDTAIQEIGTSKHGLSRKNFADQWSNAQITSVKTLVDRNIRKHLYIEAGKRKVHHHELNQSDFRAYNRAKFVASADFDDRRSVINNKSINWNGYFFLINGIQTKRHNNWRTHNWSRCDWQRNLYNPFKKETSGGNNSNIKMFDPNCDTLILAGHGALNGNTISTQISDNKYCDYSFHDLKRMVLGMFKGCGNLTKQVKIILQVCHGGQKLGEALSKALWQNKINNKVVAYTTEVAIPRMLIEQKGKEWGVSLELGINLPTVDEKKPHGPMTMWYMGKDVRFDFINGQRISHYSKYNDYLGAYRYLQQVKRINPTVPENVMATIYSYATGADVKLNTSSDDYFPQNIQTELNPFDYREPKVKKEADLASVDLSIFYK